jgi:hypothetical protein
MVVEMGGMGTVPPPPGSLFKDKGEADADLCPLFQHIARVLVDPGFLFFAGPFAMVLGSIESNTNAGGRIYAKMGLARKQQSPPRDHRPSERKRIGAVGSGRNAVYRRSSRAGLLILL